MVSLIVRQIHFYSLYSAAIPSLPHHSSKCFYHSALKNDETKHHEEAAERLLYCKIMTENPSVSLPFGLPQLPPNATSAPTPPAEAGGDSSGEIQCICDYQDDDGYTICCDKCETWQHVVCMQLPENNVPSEYLCSKCSPRHVDIRKARDSQRQRRREEGHDRGAKNHVKRKRSGTTSHKKKESPTTGQVGHTSTKSSSNADRNGTTTKAPSPRESQAPTSRKRTQRSAHPHPGTPNGSSAPHDRLSSHPPDRNGDADEEVEIEKYKYEFCDISGDSDKYANEDPNIKAFLTDATHPSKNALGLVDRCKRYTTDEFSTLSFPKVAVKLLPNTSKLYSKSRWCLELDSSVPKGMPIALFKGQIGFKDTYISEPINQYAFLNHPKPYVLFHPDLPIYIDARRYGCDSRFVRRSCRPNVMLSTITVEDGTILFGFFSTDDLKSGTELTVGWDWTTSAQLQHLAEEEFDFSKLTLVELKNAAECADNLQQGFSDCACGYGTECLLVKIKRAAGFEPQVKVLSNGTGGRKQRTKRNQSTEPNVSKEPTPDRHGNHSHFDDEDRSSSSSFVTKHKSRSRELTPSVTHDTAVETGSMTGREARKFKDVLSRIEKQEQEDHHSIPSKRRKRNSTVSVTHVNSATSPISDHSKSVDAPRRSRPLPSSKDHSPVSTPAVEVSVADASSGRRTSDSSEGSTNRRRHRTSNSPADSSPSAVWSKSRRKVVSTATKATYVDASIQTDPEADLPWWRLDQKPTPRPPRPNLRMRLMQSLLRDREEAASSATTAQDKKRKHDAIEDVEPEASPSKLPKITEHDISVSSNQKDSQTATVSISVTEIPTPSSVAPKIQLLNTDTKISEEASGPALGDLFADSDKLRKAKATADVVRPRSQSPSKAIDGSPTDRSPTNLQLPMATQTSPTPSARSAASPTPSINLQVFSPAVVSAVGGLAASSPTKTKKLSLKDYGKRKLKAVDPSDKKDEEKSPSKSSSDSPTTPLKFLNDTRKLHDILATPSDPVNNTPSTDPSRSARIADPMEGVR